MKNVVLNYFVFYFIIYIIFLKNLKNPVQIMMLMLATNALFKIVS